MSFDEIKQLHLCIDIVFSEKDIFSQSQQYWPYIFANNKQKPTLFLIPT